MSNKGFFDYYAMFSLNRELSEKDIKKILSQRQNELVKYRGSTDPNNTEVLNELQEMIEHVRTAITLLTRPEKRKQYDIDLANAVQAGQVNVQVEKEVRDILERARRFFEKGEYERAMSFAQEAIENNSNSEEPYEIISRSYYMMGEYDQAIGTVDKASKVFPSSILLRWLNVRYHILIEDYNAAQDMINKALVDFDDHPQFHAEQVYLYGYAEKDDMVESTIREYMEGNPHDMKFRQYAANNLVDIAQQCYLYDSNAEMLLITEEAQYNRCVRLLKLANSIYEDDHIASELEYAEQFGELVEDEDRHQLKVFYIILTVIMAVAAFFVAISDIKHGKIMAIVLAAFSVINFLITRLVKRKSYKPYWKVYRDTYRGFKEDDDGALYNILSAPFELIKSVIDSFFS